MSTDIPNIYLTYRNSKKGLNYDKHRSKPPYVYESRGVLGLT